MKAGWCHWYTGLVGRGDEPREGRRCGAGVLYDDVKRLPVPGRGYNLPCIGDPDTECASYLAVTPEQEVEFHRRGLERLTQASQVIATGHCTHCGREMSPAKVGHCLYAEPCGHRLNEIPREIKGLEFVTP